MLTAVINSSMVTVPFPSQSPAQLCARTLRGVLVHKHTATVNATPTVFVCIAPSDSGGACISSAHTNQRQWTRDRQERRSYRGWLMLNDRPPCRSSADQLRYDQLRQRITAAVDSMPRFPVDDRLCS